MARKRRKKKKFRKRYTIPSIKLLNAYGMPSHTGHTWKTMTLWEDQLPEAEGKTATFLYCARCGLWMDEASGQVAERPADLLGDIT